MVFGCYIGDRMLLIFWCYRMILKVWLLVVYGLSLWEFRFVGLVMIWFGCWGWLTNFGCLLRSYWCLGLYGLI